MMLDSFLKEAKMAAFIRNQRELSRRGMTTDRIRMREKQKELSQEDTVRHNVLKSTLI